MQKIYTLTVFFLSVNFMTAHDPCTSLNFPTSQTEIPGSYTACLTEYVAFGVQEESPLRPEAYFNSPMSGSVMQPFAGPATGDTTVCVYGTANISLLQFIGFITWQFSSDGESGWEPVPSDEGAHLAYYITPPLTTSTYYRAAVFQPGNGVAFSNIVFVEVVPPTPEISSFGDELFSNTTMGNQWYDANGPIPGAIGQHYIAEVPGTYYVIVTSDGCVSAPSNQIELLTVSTEGFELNSQIKIYPNPVGDVLFVELVGNTEVATFYIINSLGQALRTGLITERSTVDMRSMNPGLYLIHLNTGGLHQLRKINKQ